jgi:hypothetical protein
MFKRQSNPKYCVKVRRNMNEKWSEWAETNDAEQAKKYAKDAESLGWQTTIIDRGKRDERN